MILIKLPTGFKLKLAIMFIWGKEKARTNDLKREIHEKEML